MVHALLHTLFKALRPGRHPEISHIIVGIGNKGDQYHNTRHNIGFSVVEAVEKQIGILKRGTWCDSIVSLGKINDSTVIALAKPLTYVNRSGLAVSKLIQRYRVPLTSCLVIVDDYNLPLGTLRFRPKGTHGGHNGLKSIIAAQSGDFPRLRVGIGPKPDSIDVVEFVLSTFESNEADKVDPMVQRGAMGVQKFCTEGITAAMNTFNKKDVK